MASRGKVTTTAIAARLGLSQSTVAHILNETPGMKFSRETRDRVAQAAAALGYQTVRLSLAIKKPLRHLGVVFSQGESPSDVFPMRMMADINRVANAASYFPSIQVLPSKNDTQAFDQAVERIADLYRSRLVGGFLIDKPGVLNVTVARLVELGIPVVTINGQPVSGPNGPIPSVIIDSCLGASIATEHLLSLGHRRIGLITPRPANSFQMFRFIEGYEKTLALAQVQPDGELVRDCDAADKLATYSAVESLMGQPSPPTSLLVADDGMAIIAMHALAKLGRSVPGDVSVMGYGNWSPVARFAEPSLTTMSTPLEENARLATEMLIDLIEGRAPATVQIELKPTMVQGQTTSPKN